MKTPIEIEVEERKGKLANLIYQADNNPKVDSEQMIAFFRTLAIDVEEYKYFPTGYDALVAKVIWLASNANEWQPFLNGYVDEGNSIKVFQAIIGGLK